MLDPQRLGPRLIRNGVSQKIGRRIYIHVYINIYIYINRSVYFNNVYIDTHIRNILSVIACCLHKTERLSQKWAPLSETPDLSRQFIEYSLSFIQKSQIFPEFRTKPPILPDIWPFMKFLKWQIFPKIGSSGFCQNLEIFPKIGTSGLCQNLDVFPKIGTS